MSSSLIAYQRGLLASSLIVLSACSAFGPKKAEDIQALLDESRFDEALSGYENLSEEEQNKIELSSIKSSKDKYIAASIKQSQTLIKKQEFAKAETLLEQTAQNASSKDLEKTIESLNNNKTDYINRYMLSYQFDHAEFLVKEEKHLEILAKALANDKAFNKKQEKHLSDKQELANVIGEKGLSLYNDGNTTLAKKYLSLAYELNGEKNYQSALNQIKANEMRAHKKRLKEQASQRQEQISELSATFDEAIRSKDFTLAKETLASMNNYEEIDQDKLKADEKTYINAVSRFVQDSIKHGQVLYAKRQIAEAVSVWKKAYALAPDDLRLKENIERAEIFQKRLNELKSQ